MTPFDIHPAIHVAETSAFQLVWLSYSTEATR